MRWLRQRSASEQPSKHIALTLPLILAGLLVLIGVVERIYSTVSGNPQISEGFSETLHQFAAAFEGIFLEAVPFLLIGALVAAVVEHWFSSTEIQSVYSKHLMPGMAAGLFTGILLPVGEGGSIILARALLRKGASIPAVVVMMLSAPALNLVQLGAVFGSGTLTQVFWLRGGIGMLFAILFGLLLSIEIQPEHLLHPSLTKNHSFNNGTDGGTSPGQPVSRWTRVGVSTAREFLEFTPYVIGAGLLSAAIQALVPAGWIPPGQDSLPGQLGSAGLWAVLTSKSVIGDFFTVQTGSQAWTPASQVMFLALGAMIDLKLAVLYLQVLNKKIVLYLTIFAFGMVSLSGLVIHMIGQQK